MSISAVQFAHICQIHDVMYFVQVLTMVGNVKNTRVELKQKRAESSSWVQTHRKQESKDSTSSVETNQSDTSHTDRLIGSFANIVALEKQRKKGSLYHVFEQLISLLVQHI